MKIHELRRNLLNYDADLDVFLINGNDLMSPSVMVEAVIATQSNGTPPTLSEVILVGESEKVIGRQSGEQVKGALIAPNALLLTWM